MQLAVFLHFSSEPLIPTGCPGTYGPLLDRSIAGLLARLGQATAGEVVPALLAGGLTSLVKPDLVVEHCWLRVETFCGGYYESGSLIYSDILSAGAAECIGEETPDHAVGFNSLRSVEHQEVAPRNAAALTPDA
jgi:hypothetical protein